MYHRIERAAVNLAAVLLFGLMLLTFVDVVGRNLFNKPLTGASELTEILLALVIFLMLPQVARRNEHIVIDLIDQICSPMVRKVLDAIACVLASIMFGLIAWQCWILANRAIGYGDSTAALGIPVGPVLYGLAIMAGIVSVASLIAIVPRNRKAEPAPGEPAHEPVIV
ncbi:TRAP-type C4-dicarboxylate transport system, small permease component [Variovorax sp. PBS-H4]|uniref:TRAP transporter small permease n=1 Tax=Variovorax sp. PBS-H4 TaxID=434008 RepID=UPI001316A527|nr:TRAP transporter small permease [Variovorax sp. PBS-H4]VTU31646.1 TRAP-type C4-dicarboxylate transport system, small permease component [Variovorax sp. PBS-H4]